MEKYKDTKLKFVKKETIVKQETLVKLASSSVTVRKDQFGVLFRSIHV